MWVNQAYSDIIQIESRQMNAGNVLADKGELEEYFIIKRTVQLPPKINILFSILEKVIECPHECEAMGKESSRAFLYAFSKLAIDEQARFMNSCIKYTAKCLLKKEQESIPKASEIRHIETSVQVYSTYLKLPVWTELNFKLDKGKKTVVLGSKKKTEVLDLHHFLVRRSRKHKGCIVLQGVNSGKSSEQKKYVLFFASGLGEQIYEELFECITEAKQAELAELIRAKEEDKAGYSGENSNMVFLSSKNINEFLNYKEGVVKYLLTGKLDFRQVSQDRKEFRIEQSQKNEKVFRLEGTLEMEAREAKQQLLANLGNPRNKVVISCQVLESYSSKYLAVYEKYLFTTRIQELITIREQNLSEQEEVLFVKGMDNIMVKNFLEFLMVRIKPVSDRESRIFIFCSITLNDLITPDKVKLYLFTLYEHCTPKKSQKLIQTSPLHSIKEEDPDHRDRQANGQDSMQEGEGLQDEFHTVCGYGGEEEYMEFVEGEQERKDSQEQREICAEKLKDNLTSNYLQHRFVTAPLEGYNKAENLMKEHYLFKDWNRRKDGGVLCKNDEIVNNQKRLFKDLISRMGSNILKGGSGVLNISLPVIVFKKESHLYSIAKDFCYAPLLFEGLHDKLERVKKAVLLALSVGTLGISMEKPFNPLLGETYQGWIGGCPIYLEQISHHPPIGSYYMVGRGYRIYGQIEPKISFGMNNVKGYSERPNFLVFDDGTEIEMIYGKMIIHGLLFGEREFNFEDKIYAYDRKNALFAEINYGPRKKGMLSKSSQPWDFCYGTIYHVREEFAGVFQSSNRKTYPSKEYIRKEVSSFEGIWNEAICFDGVEYLNFKTCLPCEVEEEEFPLPSNSNYRKDLLKLIEGDLEESQEQKEIMEEIQRRDRKLREQHNGKVGSEHKIRKSVTK